MTKQPLPPITKIAERLLCDIEQAVRGFARYHKYSLGSDLRAQAMTVVRVCHRAWRERSRQAHWTNELVWAIDELRLPPGGRSDRHSGSQQQGECMSYDPRDDEPTEKPQRCQCSGDMPGHCPGPKKCPMCQTDEEEKAA